MNESIIPEVFGVIYAVTHEKEPDRVRYYGQTTGTIRRRMQGHYDTVRSGEDRPISRWLRKYYAEQDKVRFTEVRKCYSREELNQAEIDFISEGRKIGHCDLNISAGGGGVSGVPNSEIQKEKIRKKLRGEGTWKHKLTWEIVREIRARHSAGETITDIAKDYPVATCNVGQIVRNQTWVDDDYTPLGVSTYKPRVTIEQAKAFREEATKSAPKTLRYWASRWGLDPNSAARLLRNETQTDPDYDPSTVRTLSFAEFQSGVTWDQVKKMREARKEKWQPNSVLAEITGLSTSAISRMMRNETFFDPEFDPATLAKRPR